MFDKIKNYFSNIKTGNYVSDYSNNSPIIEEEKQQIITPSKVVSNMKTAKEPMKKVTFSDIGNALLDFTIRPVARRTEQIRSSIEGRPTLIPETTSEKIVFGKEPIQSLKEEKQTYQSIAEKAGVPKKTSSALGIFGVLGMSILDLYPGSSGKGKVVKELAEETSESIIKNKLKKEFTNLSDEVIESVAPKIVTVKTEKEVLDILDQAHQIKEVPTPKIEVKQVETQLPTSKTSISSETNIDPKVLSKFQKDISSPDININYKKYQVDDIGKKILKDTVESIAPRIEATIGKTLTNKEIREVADQTSEFMTEAIGREQTLKYNAALLKTRDRLATAAQSGTIDKQFIEDLLVVKSQATDAGRTLNSFKNVAKPTKQVMIEAITDLGNNVDDILNKAKGVDFNDAKQAAEFYREFISPKITEWLDLIRYNSMLSSPKTQIRNIFSNLLNTTINPVIEKALAGGWDMIASKLTGSARKEFSGEAIKYMQSFSKNFKPAWKKFRDVFSGKNSISQLDLKGIPVATKGAKGKIADVLSIPTKMLEGMDQFYSELVEAGEKAALEYRKTLTGTKMTTEEIADIAKQKAAYRLYREDLFKPGQGKILEAIDYLTSSIMKLRNAENSIISTAAKFTVPFIKTPMNIFKQGIEYSPAGFLTAWGNTNKREQFIKALYGSAIATGAATLIGSNKLTFSEPRNDEERNMWREAGKQPYSIKIGNKWISYQYLNPAIAFNLAMISGVDDMIKNKKVSADTGDVILGAMAKYATYLGDQSYFKSMGDLFNLASGDPVATGKLISNYPQQLIPFRALGGWLARLTDEYQRQAKTDKTGAEGFVDKQIQLLMMNIPGLTEMVPARENKAGEPIENKNKLFNAFSPVQVTEEDPQLAEFLADYESLKIKKAGRLEEEKKIKESVKPLYQEVQQLVKDGKKSAAMKIINKMSDEEYKAYKSIKTSEKRKTLSKNEVNMYDTYIEIQDLISSGDKKAAYKIIDKMSNEEYNAYKGIKTKLQ